MARRVSELLERIRPVGTPGPPSDGEQVRRRTRRERELEDVVAIVAGFEREAEALVEAARSDAERTHAAAAERAREIRAGRDERIAVAGAEAAQQDAETAAAQRAEIEEAAERDRAAVRARSEQLIPALVREATELIWRTFVPDLDVGRPG